MAFEGIEKKVEILISEQGPSLREYGYGFWESVVHHSRAEILSQLSNFAGDAYLLSESSLFVYDRRLVMITCGETRLIDAVEMLTKELPAESVQSLIYERKNENFPEKQPTTFAEDADRLNQLLPGESQVFGNPEGHHLSLFNLSRPADPAEDDTTTEILMYGLSSEACALFQRGTSRTKALWQTMDLDQIFPGHRWDDHLFAPAGYSLNGMRGHRYVTVHVTPDEPASYASFETNHFFAPGELLESSLRLLELFKPERFDLVLFQQGPDRELTSALGDPVIQEHLRLASGYPVHFLHFTSKD